MNESNALRDDLLAAICHIRADEFARSSYAEQDTCLERLRALSPDPNVLDLLFGKAHEDLTPEKMADKILAYQPIRL